MDQIIKRIKDHHITDLDLLNKCNNLTDLQKLCNILKEDSVIKSLNLNFNRIDDIGGKYISEVLKVNTSINKIQLGHNQLGDTLCSGVKYICDALATNTTLNALYIWRNQISDIGVKYITDMLKINRSLNELSLSLNQISDIGCKYIADILKTNMTLNTLLIRINQISDICVKYLIDILHNNPTITFITIDHYVPIIDQICVRNKHNGYQKNITLRSLC